MKKESTGRFRFIIMNLVRLLLILAFFMSLYTNRKLVLAFSIIGFIITFIPEVMGKFFNLRVSSVYEIIILFFIYGVLFLGEVRGFFAEFWWWDILLNLIASMTLGLIGLTVLYVLYNGNKIRTNPFVISSLTFCFALTIGTLWEVFEFSLDSLFNFNLQKSDIDTMKDIIVNAVGAFGISILGYSYIKHGRMKLVSELLVKTLKKSPIFFTKKETLERSSEEILHIISRGENKNLEFKSTLRTNLHTNEIDKKIEHAALKTVAAFLNSDGGILLIGVSDSGKIQGLEKDRFENNDALTLHFTNLLKGYIGVEFLPFIEFELFPFHDRHVFKIDCRKSIKPVFLKFENEEEFYVRNGPSTAKLSGRALIEYINYHF